MHSRKSRTFRSYIRNARARVGKVAGARDISNQYLSRCLFDSSLYTFSFSFFPLHSLSLHSQGLLMPRLEFDALEEIISFPAISRRDNEGRTCRAIQDSTQCVYIYIYNPHLEIVDKSKRREICPGTTRLLLIYRPEMRGHESWRA